MHNESSALPYAYVANGLHIISEFQFPELQAIHHPIAGKQLITIRKGCVSENLESVIAQGPLYQASANEFLLKVKNIARYLVKGKSEVIIEPLPGAGDSDVRLFMLSTIIGVLLHQHDILALHASCIRLPNNEAVIISGPSGAGKSTLALGLYRKGYEVLNDDVSSIFFENGQARVYPGFVRLKLWQESLDAYGYSISNLEKVRAGINKYNFPVERENAMLETLKLKGVIFINSEPLKDIEQQEVDKLKALTLLNTNTFRYKFVKSLQKTNNHFMACSTLVNTVPFVKISRPHKVEADRFATYVEDVISKL